MIFPLLMHGDVPVVELRHITCATPDGVAEESFGFRGAADHTVPAFSVVTPVAGGPGTALPESRIRGFSEFATHYGDKPVVDPSSLTT
jgi:hypothetical protein